MPSGRMFLLALCLACTSCMTAPPPEIPAPEALAGDRPVGGQSAVTPENAARYASVCHITVVRRAGGVAALDANTGSALLYRNRYLITAAHNVYSPWYAPVSSIEVRCGVLNARGPQAQRLRWPKIAVAQGYRWGPFNRDQFQYDFALVRLDQPIETAHPVDLRADVPSGEGTPVEIAGYPGDNFSDGYTLHSGNAALTSRDRKAISYSIPTFTGNSGGPVWTMVGNRPTLVAIHASGSSGRVVDQSFVTQIERMMRRVDR